MKVSTWLSASISLVNCVTASTVERSSSVSATHDIASVAGSTGAKDITVHFSIPCAGCFVHPEQDLNIHLRIEGSIQTCRTGGNIELNGASLSRSLPSNQVRSETVFFSRSPLPEAPFSVSSNMTTICLEDEAIVYTFEIQSIFHKSVPEEGIGFAFALRLGEQPTILRIQDKPVVDFDISALRETWVHVPPGSGVHVSPTSIEDEYRALGDVREQIEILSKVYNHQRHRIGKMIINEFKQCDGLSCYLKMAFQKGPYLFDVIKALFGQDQELYDSTQWKHQQATQTPFGNTANKQGTPWCKCAASSDNKSEDNNLENVNFNHDLFEEDKPTVHPTSRPKQHHPPPPPPPPPPFEHDRSKPGHFNAQGHKHPGFRHKGPPGSFLYPVIGVILSMTFLFLLVKYAKISITFCTDPRRRRDCAALQEERRNRAAYRRAAYRQRFQRLVSRFRRPKSTSDYEEKRARILDQEQLLEGSMQNEISTLQRAHEIAADMVRAEQGRQRLFHEINFGRPSGPPGYINPVAESSSVASVRTLPVYPGPPPSYEADIEGEMTVVDGFRYTPSSTDSTPESSVVDCNSRLSFETATTTTQG